MKNTYLDCLALFGVGGAHPGGLKLTREILAQEQIDSSSRILDIGCGTGQTAAFISNHYNCHVSALENNKVMLEKAEERLSTISLPVTIVEGKAEELPFEDNHFDIILSESVISFTEQPVTLSELKRVLKPNGVLLGIEMTLEKLIDKQELEAFIHFYGVTRLQTEDEWFETVKEAGFSAIRITKNDEDPDEEDLENATEFYLSENITDECFSVLETHEQFTKDFKDIVGYRVIRCTK
ncbi:methyltransferase domain-containing protein [Bacillus luteolus]|uniref:Methyltransferase domain-containing protein n=1 Tax=Litchfieldia luteola TaxID=682179 RepID=A0ABR9QDZ8_9BACI|nr:class I SAM-dependent methyltransferase [Cytobacillus luteolus]MBE4906717.1 methyltransferase domain-containing protein [Cytobacillus luteolus]MBP1940634.1 ubiquinone/menaquinone biosynthesis C-methylase UbiE [Cytobacillus luteolus]